MNSLWFACLLIVKGCCHILLYHWRKLGSECLDDAQFIYYCRISNCFIAFHSLDLNDFFMWVQVYAPCVQQVCLVMIGSAQEASLLEEIFNLVANYFLEVIGKASEYRGKR